MKTTPDPSKCFIFHSRFDVAVYRYLVTNHRDAMDALKERDIKNLERLKEDKFLSDMSLVDMLSGSLASFFGEQSPIEVSAIDSAFFNDSDIFEELLSDAIARCDFERIAEAYLAGVELPPYGAVSAEELAGSSTT
jgi:hypothetical protein